MSDFISEDDLNTFEGWLKYQAVNPATLTPDELQQWRSYFDEAHRNKNPKMGLMKLQARPGKKLYGVAVWGTTVCGSSCGSGEIEAGSFS
jgi:hypothetical protein